MSAMDKARAVMARARQRAKQAEPIAALGAFGGGAAAGAMERSGLLPTALGGFPVKPLAAAALLMLAPRTNVGVAVRGAAFGLLGAYGYNAAKSGTLIAGEDVIGADSEDSMLGLGD
jgi:hypothetical protein